MKNKIMFIIVALFSIMLLVPHKVSAETAYPTVTNDTKPDTLVGGTGDIKIEGSGTNAVIVTVNAGEFKLLEGGASQAGVVDSTRPAGYAWIGLHFVFAEGVETVEIGPQGADFDTDKETFSTEDNQLTEYFGINVEKLQTAAQAKKDYEKIYTVKWNDGETDHELTVTLIVKPENIILYEQDSDTEEVWNETEYLEESNQVKISYNILMDNDTVQMAVYWDKDTKLTMQDVEEVVKSVNANYSVAGVYTTAEKDAVFELDKTLTGDAVIYVEVALDKPAGDVPTTEDNTTTDENTTTDTTTEEENPNTVDYVTTYISLGVLSLISSIALVLYFRRNN